MSGTKPVNHFSQHEDTVDRDPYNSDDVQRHLVEGRIHPRPIHDSQPREGNADVEGANTGEDGIPATCDCDDTRSEQGHGTGESHEAKRLQPEACSGPASSDQAQQKKPARNAVRKQPENEKQRASP